MEKFTGWLDFTRIPDIPQINSFIQLIKKHIVTTYIIMTVILILLSIFANNSGIPLIKIMIAVLFIIFIMTLMVIFNKVAISTTKKWLEVYAKIFVGCTMFFVIVIILVITLSLFFAWPIDIIKISTNKIDNPTNVHVTVSRDPSKLTLTKLAKISLDLKTTNELIKTTYKNSDIDKKNKNFEKETETLGMNIQRKSDWDSLIEDIYNDINSYYNQIEKNKKDLLRDHDELKRLADKIEKKGDRILQFEREKKIDKEYIDNQMALLDNKLMKNIADNFYILKTADAEKIQKNLFNIAFNLRK